jgi:hypothetical protein
VKINFCKTFAKNENENFRFNTTVSAPSQPTDFLDIENKALEYEFLKHDSESG